MTVSVITTKTGDIHNKFSQKEWGKGGWEHFSSSRKQIYNVE